MKKSCIIIGAGLSGLVAAHELIENNWEVLILDKGRGVGGRLATRRAVEARFDHGAQYFSTKTPDFQAFVQNLIDKKIAKEWQLQESSANFTHPRLIGIQGMSSIAKFLAEGLQLKLSEKVLSIEESTTGYSVKTEAGSSFEAQAIICTAPAPQAIELMSNSQLHFPEISQLEQIKYHPCIAVMASLKQATNIPQPGGISFENGPIAWIADNYQKGISPTYAVTLHASPDYSLVHFDDDLMEVGKDLLNEVENLIPSDSIDTYQVHRWRYSLAYERLTENCLRASMQSPLIFAGDGFGIGSIEGAYLSGKSAAQELIKA